MRYLLDGLYLFLFVASFPLLILKRKHRLGLRTRFTGAAPSVNRCVWFHGVSVGEIHLLRGVVGAFRQRYPGRTCVVSATTQTGFDEARKWFADCPVIRWPLDFSWAVERALNAVRPELIVLAESELWPNFLLAARRRRIPVVAINVRMSPRSARRYERFRSLARHWLGMVSHFAVQTPEYAERLRNLGVPGHRISVSGSVKYDGVRTDRANTLTKALRELFNISENDLVWVAGSTQAPEEEIVRSIFQRLRLDFPSLRLILVPRQRERFDPVARELAQAGVSFVRRSEMTGPVTDRASVILVDTFGELGALWGLADVAFVGGSLDGQRGGQNMIEPAAFGAGVIFGPHVWNFRDSVQRLLDARSAIQVRDAAELETAGRRLLGDEMERRRLGDAARELVLQQQGATQRTFQILDQFIQSRSAAVA